MFTSSVLGRGSSCNRDQGQTNMKISASGAGSVNVFNNYIVSLDSGKWALTVAENSLACWENKPLLMSPGWVSFLSCRPSASAFSPRVPHFRLLLVSVVWKTLEADMRFSMYWPRTWFSDFNFKFSSLTVSTRADRSARKIKNENVEFLTTSSAAEEQGASLEPEILSQLSLGWHLGFSISETCFLTLPCKKLCSYDRDIFQSGPNWSIPRGSDGIDPVLNSKMAAPLLLGLYGNDN